MNDGQVPGTGTPSVRTTGRLHGPQVTDCGGGSNRFKGLADHNTTFALPDW